jgi:hypothetical protein
LRLAEALASEYADGAWFVDLAGRGCKHGALRIGGPARHPRAAA